MRVNAAVNALRGFGPFQNASLRLLEDLVDDSPESQQHPYSLRSFALKAKDRSFSLYWSLDLAYWPDELREGPALHLIWLCERAGMGAPLQALAHFLARSIALGRGGEPAAVATVTGNALHLVRWNTDGTQSEIGDVKAPKAKAITQTQIAKKLGVTGSGTENPFCHLIVVQPNGAKVPGVFAGEFHRIVAVTDDPGLHNLPSRIGNIHAILKPDVFKEGAQLPHYCALIPTVILPPPSGEKPPPSDPERWWKAAGALYGSAPFKAEAVAAGSSDTPKRDPDWRLSRDMCRLWLDLEPMKQEKEIPPRSPELDLIGDRWARAVTNRQVGLALSGGGACLYRLVPLIKNLHENQIPIDIVGGVSGGALLGAYYCARGLEGIEQAIREGPNINWYGLAAMADSRALQFKVDYDLNAARIEDLFTRFVAITTALDDERRPEGQAVVVGTVGEAVRMSGSALIQFGRSVKGTTRYTDGGNSVMIPARALRDYGADVIFACNAIPGPATGNPFSGLSPTWLPLQKLTSFVVQYTEIGRFIDAWIAIAFMIEQSSREVEEDASEYAEVATAPAAQWDGVRFWAARELAETPPKPPPTPKRDSEPDDGPPPQTGTRRIAPDGDAAAAFADRWECARRSPRLKEEERLKQQQDEESKFVTRTSPKSPARRKKKGTAKRRAT